MKRVIFFSSFVGALFLLAGASYFFIFFGTKATAVISNVRPENIIGSGAQIKWDTNIPSDSRVAYGTSPTFLTLFSNSRCDSGGYVTVHCVNLTGLAASTVYYYKVESMDASSTNSQLGGFQFTSASGGGGDTIAPSVPTGLTATAISSSQINLSWTASSDNVGVAGYKIYKNGSYAGSVTSGTTYSSTGLSASTSYSYTVAAFDAAGNPSEQSSPASAMTQTSADMTAPTVSITAPTAGATVSGTITVSASASDNVGVVGVQFKVDGANLASEDTSSPYSVSWNTASFSNGSHVLTATARDAAGNPQTSPSITVTVSNVFSDTYAPSVPTGLTATAISSSQINLSWTASSDNVGVAGYKIYKNGAYADSVTSGTTYSSTGLSAGASYSYAVAAFDAVGNISEQSASAVTATFASGGGGGSTSGTSDTTAPIITNVRAENIISSGAQIKWSTDDLSDSLVQFGTISGSLAPNSSFRCDAGGNVTEHCINLTGLALGTAYYYKVVSKNASNYEAKSSEYSFVSSSSTTAIQTTVPQTGTSVVFSVNVGAPFCKNGGTTATATFTVDPDAGGYFLVNNQKISSSVKEFPAGAYSWVGTVYSGYTVFGVSSGAFTVPKLDSCSGTTDTLATTTSPTEIQTNPRAYIALWQGDINVLSGQAIQGDVRINVGVDRAESVALYSKSKDAAEPRLLGQAVRSTDNPSLWRFAWDSRTVPDGDVVIFSRVKNANGEYQGDSAYVVVKNAVSGTAPGTTSEAVSIVEELFAHPENLEVAKVFLTQKIEKFLETSTVEEKQRAAEKIRKDLALDILVTDTGSTEVQVGTTTLSRQKEPELVIREISRAVKNRDGASVLEDTDKDTLSDYDETYIYNTDPKRADSDSDGVNDGEEIFLGMNPLKDEVALVPYENPKNVEVAAKADPKEFSVSKVELLPAPESTKNEPSEKKYVTLEGTALPNSYIKLYIFSTPVVVTVKTDNDGKWQYTMDKELDDGTHEVYLAMTESAGKIIVKSDPIPFVKTAQAVSLQPEFALANTAAESPAGFFRGGTLALSLVVLLIILGLSFIAISFVSKKKEIPDDNNV